MSEWRGNQKRDEGEEETGNEGIEELTEEAKRSAPTTVPIFHLSYSSNVTITTQLHSYITIYIA